MSDRSRIAAVVLAAGESRRMGRPKLLLPYGDTTILGAVVRVVSDGGIAPRVVVIGRDVEAVRESLRAFDVIFVSNPSPEDGMLSSVKLGIRACGDVDGVLVALGDQPHVASSVIDRVTDAFRASASGIVVAAYQGKCAHPMILDARYRDEILALPLNVGLNELLSRHPADIELVEASDPSILDDIDTPDDYRRLVGMRLPDRNAPGE